MQWREACFAKDTPVRVEEWKWMDPFMPGRLSA